MYIPIPFEVFNSVEFVRSNPVERSTYVSLLFWSFSQQASGKIYDCKDWGNDTWQQMCRVRLKEVRNDCRLFHWEGDDLVLFWYPFDAETSIIQSQDKRRKASASNGKKGGRPKKNTQETPEPNNLTNNLTENLNNLTGNLNNPPLYYEDENHYYYENKNVHVESNQVQTEAEKPKTEKVFETDGFVKTKTEVQTTSLPDDIKQRIGAWLDLQEATGRKVHDTQIGALIASLMSECNNDFAVMRRAIESSIAGNYKKFYLAEADKKPPNRSGNSAAGSGAKWENTDEHYAKSDLIGFGAKLPPLPSQYG